MSLINDQLLQRIQTIEDKLNEIQTALNNLIPKKIVNAAIALKQQEIDTLQTRVTTLESQIAILQANLD